MKKSVNDHTYFAKLRETVAYHQKKYHEEDAPEISDAAYDALVKELEALEASLGETSVVTNRVGGAPSAAFSKVTHQVRQWSFDNVFDYAELEAWEGRLRRYLAKEGIENPHLEYVAEHKIDGLKLVIEYRDGVFVRAATRGDGVVGEDVTHTAAMIASLPKTLTHPVTLQCVGEVWMSATAFTKLNAAEIKKGEEPFANPRNAAAGSLRQLDPKIAQERALSLSVYDVDVWQAGKAKLPAPTTQAEELAALKTLGLPVNPHSKLCHTLTEVQTYYESWKAKVDDLPYGVDGIVLKANDVTVQQAAGYTAKAPRFGIAYKFPAIETTTVIEAIEVQVGRTGVVTPVAHLRSVLIDGSTVTRATLHNEDQIKRLDVRTGDTVVVRKAGDVIPEVVMVIAALRPKNTKPYAFPKTVALCGGDGSIERISGTAAYRCTSLDSDFLRRQRLYYFVSKSALNIDGVGPKVLDALLDQGFITDAADLFTVTKEQLLQLPGFKEKSADNFLSAVASVRTVSLSRFLVALSIDQVGEETAKLLAMHYGDIEHIKTASLESLQELNGIGEIVAANIREWQDDAKAQALLKKLLQHITPRHEAQKVVDGPLQDTVFVFTGTLTTLTRSAAQAKAATLGATIGTAVTKHTTHLVAGDKAGSKLKEATKYGAKILTEAEFLALVD